jgi:hypothetical protein
MIPRCKLAQRSRLFLFNQTEQIVDTKQEHR